MTDSELVKALLSKYPNTRDSDTDLIIGVLQAKGANLSEHQRQVIRDTNFESIRRQRQQLQREGQFPASPEVQAKRLAKSDRVRSEIVDTGSDAMQQLIAGGELDDKASDMFVVPEKKFERQPLPWRES